MLQYLQTELFTVLQRLVCYIASKQGFSIFILSATLQDYISMHPLQYCTLHAPSSFHFTVQCATLLHCKEGSKAAFEGAYSRHKQVSSSSRVRDQTRKTLSWKEELDDFTNTCIHIWPELKIYVAPTIPRRGRSKCLDEAITWNGFGHFQVAGCHLGLIPAAFSRFPGFPSLPLRRLRCHFFR